MGIKIVRVDKERDIWEVQIGEHKWDVTGKMNVRRCIQEDYTSHLVKAVDRLEDDSFADMDGNYVMSEPVRGRPWWGISSGNSEDENPDVPWARKE